MGQEEVERSTFFLFCIYCQKINPDCLNIDMDIRDMCVNTCGRTSVCRVSLCCRCQTGCKIGIDVNAHNNHKNGDPECRLLQHISQRIACA